MEFKSNSKPLILSFLSIVVIAILIIFYRVGILQPVFGLFKTGLAPLQSYAYDIGDRTASFFRLLGSIRDLEARNEELEKEVMKLHVNKGEIKALARENKVLREQLDFVETREEKMIPSFVIDRDPSDFFVSFGIDRGRKSGVAKNMPVVISDGVLVGQIYEADEYTATILPTVDARSSINAEVVNSGARGIVSGEHNLALIMDMIPQNQAVKKGDLVVTSGLGQLFPKGLLLGEVEEVSNSDNALFQKASIKPLFNFQDLRIIFVITSW